MCLRSHTPSRSESSAASNRVCGPAVGRTGSGEVRLRQDHADAVRIIVLADAGSRLLFLRPSASKLRRHHPRPPTSPVKPLAGDPARGILADAGHQGSGAQTNPRTVTPPHRTFKKNPPERHEEIRDHQGKAHSSRHIRIEHGIAHLKKRQARDHREHSRKAGQMGAPPPSPINYGGCADLLATANRARAR